MIPCSTVKELRDKEAVLKSTIEVLEKKNDEVALFGEKKK